MPSAPVQPPAVWALCAATLPCATFAALYRREVLAAIPRAVLIQAGACVLLSLLVALLFRPRSGSGRAVQIVVLIAALAGPLVPATHLLEFGTVVALALALTGAVSVLGRLGARRRPDAAPDPVQN